MPPSPPPPFPSTYAQGLTTHLLTTDPTLFSRATQSRFLSLAALGTLSRPKLGLWLTYDRLYIHAYIEGTGKLIALVASLMSKEPPEVISNPDIIVPAGQTPPTAGVPQPQTQAETITRLTDWLVDSLVNVRREEKFFVDVAGQYDISLSPTFYSSSSVDSPEDASAVEGMTTAISGFEKLFGVIGGGEDGERTHTQLPWLEGAITFWATEKCYLEAWKWAKAQVAEESKVEGDDPVTKHFIPNWTSTEFEEFVDRLGDIIDRAVAREIAWRPTEKEGILMRAKGKYDEVLKAEEAFWPKC